MTAPRVIRDPGRVRRGSLSSRAGHSSRTVAVLAGAAAVVSIATLPEVLDGADVARFAVSLTVLCAATCVVAYRFVDRWMP